MATEVIASRGASIYMLGVGNDLAVILNLERETPRLSPPRTIASHSKWVIGKSSLAIPNRSLKRRCVPYEPVTLMSGRGQSSSETLSQRLTSHERRLTPVTTRATLLVDSFIKQEGASCEPVRGCARAMGTSNRGRWFRRGSDSGTDRSRSVPARAFPGLGDSAKRQKWLG
jgi:hypothetical protein